MMLPTRCTARSRSSFTTTYSYSSTDLNSLNQAVTSVQSLVVTLQGVVDGLGGSQ